MADLKLVNVTELLVFELLDSVLDQIDGFCRCQRCRLDVAAIALNDLPANYVVTGTGEVRKRISTLESQIHADIIQAVIRAAEKVVRNPHHSRD